MPRSYGNFESPFWVFSRPPALTSLPVSPVWLPGAVNKVCKHPESCRDAAERSGWRPWLRSVPTAGRLVLSGWERRLGPPTSGRGGVREDGRFSGSGGGVSGKPPHRFWQCRKWEGVRERVLFLYSTAAWGTLAACQCFPEPWGARPPCVTDLYSGDGTTW